MTGRIDLNGEQTQGSLAISFSETAILDIMERMLGERSQSIDDTVVDVVGEITNMITGSAKRLFSEQGVEFNLTLPSTSIGQEHPLRHSVNGQPILLPFCTGAGKIYVEVCIA